MIYRIAEFNIEILSKYRYTHQLCKKFLCADASHADFSVSVTDEEIEHEKRLDVTVNGTENSQAEDYESLAIFRKICAEVLRRDGFLMHGVLVEYEGKGIIFTAPSGTGKTTHVQAWQRVFGDKVHIINGDKPILRFLNGAVWGYGGPWNGKENYGTNAKVPINAIVCLCRGKDNRIGRLSVDEGLPFLMSQIMVHDSSDLAKQLLLLDELLGKVPVYKLFCNTEDNAATVARDGLFG